MAKQPSKASSTKAIKGQEGIKMQTGPFGGPARDQIGRPVPQPTLDPRRAADDDEITPVTGAGPSVPVFTNPWSLEERRRYVEQRVEEHRQQEEARRAEEAKAAKSCCRCGCWKVLFGGWRWNRGQQS